MMTADICVWFCAHRLMYRPFCVQNNSAHSHNLLIYASCTHSFAERNSQQPKRAGQGRGAHHPFAKNSQQPPYPCFYLILPVSTTDKLIFESCVLVVYLTWAVALCLPPVLLCLYPSRLARESYLVILCPCRYTTAYNSQTAARSLDLTIGHPNMLGAGTFTSPQYRLVYHTIKQAIMHSKVAARSKA